MSIEKVYPYTPPGSEIIDRPRLQTPSRRTWNDYVVVLLTLIQYFFGIVLVCVALIYKADVRALDLLVVAVPTVIPPGISLVALRRRGSTAYYVSMLTSLFSMSFLLESDGDPNPLLASAGAVAYFTAIFAWRA